jgi:hypothetical protein
LNQSPTWHPLTESVSAECTLPESLLASGLDEYSGGCRFRIPILVPEGVPTGDGRMFMPFSLRTRTLPIPLLWQSHTDTGHDGSIIVGRIDSVERLPNGLGNACGVLDTSPAAREVERLIRHRFLRGISADLDQFEGAADDDSDADIMGVRRSGITVRRARVMAATLVAKPAFQECFIILDDEEPPMIDGTFEEPVLACASTTMLAPEIPPAQWFSDPLLREPTPLTITDEGHVFGHIAAWHTSHIGLPTSTRPPRSRSGYAYFHTGVVRVDDGNDIPVGQLTLAGGHAPLSADAFNAVKHYDDTSSAVADVCAGEDAFGIWVAGALRPTITHAQVRALRASSPSGDWRPINGRLELVAVCQVNVPGFPVARAHVASGQMLALVAAGASAIASLTPSLEDRVAALEASLTSMSTSTSTSTSSLVNDLVFEIYSSPLDDAASLSFIERATSLNRLDVIPPSWLTTSDPDPDPDPDDVLQRHADVVARVAALRYRPNYEYREDDHPRHPDGKWRQVIARIRRDLEIERAAQSVSDALDAADNDTRSDNDSDAASSVAKSIADSGMAQGDDTTKYAFSQLPQPIRELIDGFLKRVAESDSDSDASKALKEYRSGVDLMSSDEIQGFLSTIMRELLHSSDKD